MTIPIPTSDEFYAIFRVDTQEVIWFELTEEAAESKALILSTLPEYKDVMLCCTLCGREGLDG
jgi:hypothetical protein